MSVPVLAVQAAGGVISLPRDGKMLPFPIPSISPRCKDESSPSPLEVLPFLFHSIPSYPIMSHSTQVEGSPS